MKPLRTSLSVGLVFGLGDAAEAQKDPVRVNSKEAPSRPGAPYSQGVMAGPAWTSVGVAALPGGARIEIEPGSHVRFPVKG